ncbi:hypothetical protein [Derxia gummosa]|uniref:Uncharacterized protein n=1 Tax=Derxia gummosa DSM 723 TaxID=1121388 RepID=A0A8B6X158_9BURK|nr:hypothetical protein [Derxia gummosa]
MPQTFSLRSVALAAALGLTALPVAFADDGAPARAVIQAGTTAQSDAIRAVLTSLNSLFTTSVPAAGNAALLDLFASDFLDGGDDRASVLTTDGLLSTDNIGITFSLTKIISVASDGKSLLAKLSIAWPGNASPVEAPEMQFVLGTDGKWRFWGDRRLGYVEPHSINQRQRATASSAWNYSRWMEFSIDSSTADTVKYVRFSGPGLPAARSFSRLGSVQGIVYGRTADGDFRLVDTSLASLDTSWIPDCATPYYGLNCVDLTTMKSSSRYNVVFYNASYRRIGEVTTMGIPSVPYANDVVATKNTSWFATPKTFRPALRGSIVNGSTVSLTWTLPTSYTMTMENAGVYLRNSATTMNVYKGSWDGALAPRGSSASFGQWTGSVNPTSGNVWLSVKASAGHRFVTSQDWPY